MANSEGDESDSLIMSREQVRASSWMPPSGAQLAWEDMDLDVCTAELPEPEKVGKIKKILRCVGIGKSSD